MRALTRSGCLLVCATMSDPTAVFAKDVGTWDAEIVIRPGPGAPELRSKGVSVQKLVGGRWLVADFTNESGFEGHGLFGWDETRKSYVGTWVDTMRTFLAVMAGAYDAESRTMTYSVETTTPDGRAVRWREVTQTVDADTQIFRQLWPAPDGDFEMMTVTYRRRR